MNEVLSLLLVEDSEDDALLIVQELRRSGFAVDFKRVGSREDFRRALESGRWDAVICDYVLPGFSGLDALDLFRGSGLDIPFIIVSGVVGEEIVVESMRRGAHDYILKESLVRLGPALDRQLKDAAERRSRRTMESTLHESEHRFRMLAENSRDLVTLASAEGALQYVSPCVQRLLGYRPDRLAGVNFADLVHPDDRERVMQEFRRIAGSGGATPALEHRLRRRDDAYVWFETLLEAVVSDEGKVVNLLANSRDVSERREIEARFRQVQKMESLGNLAGGIAHDFNNILAVINGYSELILNLQQANEQVKRFAQEINRSGERAAQLVKQILTFARKTDTHFHTVQINDTIREICELLRETFPRSIEIELRLDENLPPIEADSQQISQVLMNLAVNARDIMKDSGGRLTFSTEQVGGCDLPEDFRGATDIDYIRIQVSDTGYGMDEEVRSRIFEPFFTTKEVGEGTGLGLAVVYGIIQNHCGHIEVVSRPGRGTVFNVYFPTSMPPKDTQGTAHHFREPAGGDETLLLVEDEAMVAEWIRWSLTKKGYRVLWARNAIEAMSQYEQEKDVIALVLADHGLPGMSGWDFHLKLREVNPELPFLIATGYLDSNLRKSMLDSGVTGFLHKPFKRKELLQHIRQILDARAARAGE